MQEPKITKPLTNNAVLDDCLRFIEGISPDLRKFYSEGNKLSCTEVYLKNVKDDCVLPISNPVVTFIASEQPGLLPDVAKRILAGDAPGMSCVEHGVSVPDVFITIGLGKFATMPRKDAEERQANGMTHEQIVELAKSSSMDAVIICCMTLVGDVIGAIPIAKDGKLDDSLHIIDPRKGNTTRYAQALSDLPSKGDTPPPEENRTLH